MSTQEAPPHIPGLPPVEPPPPPPPREASTHAPPAPTHPLYQIAKDVGYARKAAALENSGESAHGNPASWTDDVDLEQAKNQLWKIVDLAFAGHPTAAGTAMALVNGDPNVWRAIGDALGGRVSGAAGLAGAATSEGVSGAAFRTGGKVAETVSNALLAPQRAGTGMVLEAMNGPELWQALSQGATAGGAAKAGELLTKAAIKGVKEHETYYHVAQKLGVPEKIPIPYAPDIHPAALLGLLGDIVFDPLLGVGLGGLTETGKLARAYTEAVKTGRPIEEMGDLARRVTEARLNGQNLNFGSTFAQRLERNQQRYFVIEHPFRKPSVVRISDVPSLAKASEAVREMVPFVPEDTFAKFQRLPVGLSVLKFKGQEGVESGARVTLGHIPGSRVWTPKGFVRQVFNADKGIRDARLGQALLDVPLFKLPTFEPFNILGVQAIGNKQAEVMTTMMIGKAARLFREAPIIGAGANAVGKAFLPYYRPVGADPVVANEVQTEIRSLADGIASAKVSDRERLRKAFETDDATKFQRVAIPILRKFGLDEDGIIIPMLKGPVPKIERMKLLLSMESAQRLLGPDGSFAAELFDRAMKSTPGNDLLRAERYAKLAPHLAADAMLDGIQAYDRAISVNEEDLARIAAGEQPLRLTVRALETPEAMTKAIQEEQARLIQNRQELELTEQELRSRPEPPGPEGGGPAPEPAGPPPPVGGPGTEGGGGPRSTPGTPETGVPAVSSNFQISEHLTAGEVQDGIKAAKQRVADIEKEMQKARNQIHGKSTSELAEIDNHVTELDQERHAILREVDQANLVLHQAGVREARGRALMEAGKQAAQHPGAHLKAIDVLPEAHAEMAALHDALETAPPGAGAPILRQIHDLEHDTVQSYVERQTRQTPERYPEALHATSERALEAQAHTQAAQHAEKMTKEAQAKAEKLAKGFQAGVPVGRGRGPSQVNLRDLETTLEPRLESELAHGPIRDALAELHGHNPEEASRIAAEAGIPDELLPTDVLRQRATGPVLTTGEQYGDELAAKAGMAPEELRSAAFADPQAFHAQLSAGLREAGVPEGEIGEVNFLDLQTRLRGHAAHERMALLPGGRVLSPESLGLTPERLGNDLGPKLDSMTQGVRQAVPDFDPGWVGAEVTGHYHAGQGQREHPVDVLLFYTNHTDQGKLSVALEHPDFHVAGGPGSVLPPTPIAVSPHLLMEGETPTSVARSLAPTHGGQLRREALGGTTTASGVDPTKVYNFRFKVVELDDLVPSHTDLLKPNPGYPTELQPRKRGRVPSELQVQKMAATLHPDWLLSDTHMLDFGSPIVGVDNLVEGGNGRVLAMRLARTDFPDRWSAYENELRIRAQEFGVDASGFDNPVLVRERETQVPSRASFAEETNPRRGLAMSATENATVDARHISDQMVEGLQVGPEQTIEEALKAAANRQFVRDFLATIPANDLADLVTESGELNKDGLARMRAALFARTFPGESGQKLANTFLESIDSSVKRVEQAVFASLPQLAKSEALIRTGQRAADLSIGEDLATALDVLARMRQDGVKLDEFLGTTKQGAMFAHGLTDFQVTLLTHLDALSASTAKTRELLRDYAKAVEEAPPLAPANQETLFGNVAEGQPQPTKEELFGRVTEAQKTRPESGELFAEQAAAENAATPASHGPRLENPGASLADVEQRVGQAVDSAETLRKNPHHAYTYEPQDPGKRIAEIHNEKVSGAHAALDAFQPKTASELAAKETAAANLENAAPSSLRGPLSEETKKIQGKPRKPKEIKSKVNLPLKANGESVASGTGGQVTGSVDDALKAMGEADKKGESIAKTFLDQAKDESGQIDAEFLLTLAKALRKHPDLQRGMVTEMVDNLIRFDPKHETQMLRVRREMIDWLDDRFAAEMDFNHAAGFQFQYAPHVPLEKSLLGSFARAGGIKDIKQPFEKGRSLLMSANEANFYAERAGRPPRFNEDALVSLFVRHGQSQEAVQTAEWLERQMDHWGVPVSSIEPNSWEAKLGVAEKMGIGAAPLKEARALAEQIENMVGDLGGTAAGQHLIEKAGGMAEVKLAGARLGARTEDEAVAMAVPAVKQYLKWSAELDALLPETAVVIPRGAFRRYPSDVPPDLLKETEAKISAAARDLLGVLSDLKTKVDEPLVQVPLHKVKALIAADPYVRAYLVPKEVADAINKGIRNHASFGPEMSRWLRLHDHVLGLMRGYTTVLFPAFFNRNFGSAIWNNLLKGISDPGLYMNAVSVLTREVGFVFRDRFGVGHSLEQIREGMARNMVRARGFTAFAFGDQLHDVSKYQALNPLSQNNLLLRAGRAFNQSVESVVRTATYLDGIYRGLSPETAARITRETQFDYQALTAFERDVASRWVFFYPWARNNIPFQLRYLLTRPGKWSGALKVKQAFENSVPLPDPKLTTALLGDREQFVPIPVAKNADGTYRYWNMGSWWPGGDLFQLFDNPGRDLLGMLTPLISKPAEVVWNHSLYWGTPTEKYPGETAMFLGQHMEKREIAAFRTSRWLNELDHAVFKGVLADQSTWQQAVLEEFIGRTYSVSFYDEAKWRMLDLHHEIEMYRKAALSEMGKGFAEDSPKIKAYKAHMDELGRERETIEQARNQMQPTGGK